MQDIITQLSALRRPRLLMRAARIGAKEYQRQIHLGRLLGHRVPPQHGAALVQLIEIEAILNEQRLNEDSSYSLLRHIDVMIAIVGEADALRLVRDAVPK